MNIKHLTQAQPQKIQSAPPGIAEEKAKNPVETHAEGVRPDSHDQLKLSPSTAQAASAEVHFFIPEEKNLHREQLGKGPVKTEFEKRMEQADFFELESIKNRSPKTL